jgi:hypothetical protein
MRGAPLFGAVGAAALLALTPAPGGAQTLLGHVLDSIGAQPLPSAAVILLDSVGTKVRYTLSDSTGRFVLKAPREGRYQVYVDQLSYKAFVSDTVALAKGQKLQMLLRLVPTPVALDPMAVTVRRGEQQLTKVGFYRREKASIGYTMNPQQVRDERPFVVTDLLRQIPEVLLEPTDGIGSIIAYRPHGTMSFMPDSWSPNGCLMKVVVDGVVYHQDMGISIDDVLPAGDVLAIEVYPNHGIGAPIQHRGPDSACGVVLIWTRDRR